MTLNAVLREVSLEEGVAAVGRFDHNGRSNRDASCRLAEAMVSFVITALVSRSDYRFILQNRTNQVYAAGINQRRLGRNRIS